MNVRELVRSRPALRQAESDMTDSIVLGSYLAKEKDRKENQNEPPVSAPSPQVFIDAPDLLPHKNKPWLQAHLHERYDVPFPNALPLHKLLEPAPPPPQSETCAIPADVGIGQRFPTERA